MSEKKLEIKTTEEVLDEAYKKFAKLIGKETLESLTPENVKEYLANVEASEAAKVVKEILTIINTKWVSVESLKQWLCKEREKHEQIENSTASDLWREGARWDIRLIDELLGLLESESC